MVYSQHVLNAFHTGLSYAITHHSKGDGLQVHKQLDHLCILDFGMGLLVEVEQFRC